MTDAGPAITGVHHFSPTVSDVEASAGWYQRVFRLQRVPVQVPHHGDEKGGYAVLLLDPASGFAIGLHHHDANPGDPYDERRTGLDHIAFNVSSRAALDEWAAWLDEQGVAHSGITESSVPMDYAVIVFRDPDNLQLELFHAAG